MQEKTKILLSIESIFFIAMIVIAFGSFIENQNNSVILTDAPAHLVKINSSESGSLSLKKEKDNSIQFKDAKIEIKKLN